jgi:hypothetical protein
VGVRAPRGKPKGRPKADEAPIVSRDSLRDIKRRATEGKATQADCLMLVAELERLRKEVRGQDAA